MRAASHGGKRRALRPFHLLRRACSLSTRPGYSRSSQEQNSGFPPTFPGSMGPRGPRLPGCLTWPPPSACQDNLVTSRQQYHRVKVMGLHHHLHRIRNQIPAGERIAHPLCPLAKTVADGNGLRQLRDPAHLDNSLFRVIRQIPQMRVTRHHLAEGTDHRHKGLFFMSSSSIPVAYSRARSPERPSPFVSMLLRYFGSFISNSFHNPSLVPYPSHAFIFFLS